MDFLYPIEEAVGGALFCHAFCGLMALQDELKFSLIQLCIAANTRVENVAKSNGIYA